MEEEESFALEGLQVPDLIEYDSVIDSDSDDNGDIEMKHASKKTCNDHCSK